MFEAVILGLIQGVAEWLPVSSEGLLVLTQVNVFGANENFIDLVSLALFLHLGTFFSAIVYFRKEVKGLIDALLNYNGATAHNRLFLKFLLITTVLGGVVGFALIKFAEQFSANNIFYGQVITLLIGTLLLITGVLQLKAKNEEEGSRGQEALTPREGVILGIAQGLAALPGLSRSGITVAAFLLRKFREEEALKFSFIMSLPIVLVGNVFLNIFNLSDFVVTKELLVGLLVAFVSGLITIHLLLQIAKRVNFGKFIIGFAILVLLSAGI